MTAPTVSAALASQAPSDADILEAARIILASDEPDFPDWVVKPMLGLVLRLREENGRVAKALCGRYVSLGPAEAAERTAKELQDLITDICRIRGECDANEELARFVHYLDHTLNYSPGELSRVIDFAQGQMKRAEAAESRALQAAPDDLRAAGWTVAVHNDYRLNGEAHTFWLLTKDGRAVKGEGRTDAEALNQIRAALTTQPVDEENSR